MVDVFVALNKQSVIVNKVLNNLQSDEQLIMRALTLLTALDHEPKTVRINFEFLYLYKSMKQIKKGRRGLFACISNVIHVNASFAVK
jgi:hypothetical protein